MVSRMWQGIIFVSLLTIVLSTPSYPRQTPSENLIGQSTKVIATAILQDYEDKVNLVFSPFGYSTILAILAEGSKGETELQLSKVLKLAKENSVTRNAYKEILTSLKEKYTTNFPQFHTWFYVHKNFSVEENYKKVLLENYLTEVKNVYPPEFDPPVTNTTEVKETQENSAAGISEDKGNSAYHEKQIIQQAEKASYFKENHAVTIPTSGSTQQGFSSDESIPQQTSNHIKNKVTTEIKGDKTEDIHSKSNTPYLKVDEIQTDADTNKKHDIHKIRDMNIKEKTGDAQPVCESKAGLSFDLAKIFPGITRKGGKSAEDTESLMIIFNGLYFAGNWETPFEMEVASNDFYLNETAKVQAQTIKTKGMFKIGELPHLDSTALSLPYQGGKYSLLIILPKKFNGLNKVISEMNGTTLQDVFELLEDKEVEIQLPKFTIESTTKPVSGLRKMGVTNLFGKCADFSGISNEAGLYVQDLVQLVTIEVDESIGTTNFMTATSVTSRGIKETFNVNHPFLFFIEDNIFKVTMVAGKILDPTVTTM